MAYDGAIRFNTKIDNSQARKDLKELEREIRKSEETISKNQNAKLPLEKQLESINQELSTAMENLKLARAELKAAQDVAISPNVSQEDYVAATAAIPSLQKGVNQASKEVNNLRKKYQSIKSEINDCDIAIQRNAESIAENTAEAERLYAELNSGSAKMAQGMEKAQNSAKKFQSRMWELAKSALIFNVISAGLRSAKEYMSKALKTNEEYTAQMAKLKGTLLTAFQPLYEVALPGLLAVLRVLTAIVQVAASVLSFLTGKTAAQSAKNAKALNDQANAIGAVGGAAKEAKKELAGFDEINTLGSPDTGGGGGGGGAGNVIPDFDGMDDLTGSMSNLLGIVAAIGAALLTWNIAKGFTSTLSLAAGLAMTVGGAFLYAFNWVDAFSNGVEWGNLNLMLAGMLAIIGGLYLAFGSVGAAIGALVTGAGLLIVALKDFQKTGELSNETLMAIAAGILAIGGGIALLTGSWIPLVIAGVIALISTLATEFNWIKVFVMEPLAKTLVNLWNAVIDGALGMFDAIKQVFNGVAQFIGGIFRGSIKDAVNGIISILNGFISAFYNAINSVIRGINAISIKIPNWVPEFGGQTWGPNLDLLNVPQIPMLAQGAVLPANKPFLAMVGDQKNGTNVEAPLETIKQALAEVMAEHGDGDVNVNIYGDLAPFVRWLKVEIDRENKRVGPSLVGGNV